MSKFLLSGGAEAATCELRLQLFRVYSESRTVPSVRFTQRVVTVYRL